MIRFFLNNEQIETDQHPAQTSIDFIRLSKRLTGTKIGCREGDCGACTVLIGEKQGESIFYKSAPSCITPLGNFDGKHVVTVEGINNDDLNPIQKAFVDQNAIQCGFCTPGLILSLMGLCLSENDLTFENAKLSIAGNICRCTGYKSIERALEQIVTGLKKAPKKTRHQWLIENGYIPEYFGEIFSKLPDQSPPIMGHKIIGGGSDILVQNPVHIKENKITLISQRLDLKGISLKKNHLHIGATTTIEELAHSKKLEAAVPNIKEYVKRISSRQVRNISTVAGNIANASPIADLSVILMALETTVILEKNNNLRELSLSKFFLDYKKIDLEEGEIIHSFYFPLPEKNATISFEKICKRTHLDMAEVNSAMKLILKGKKIEKIVFAVGGIAPTTLLLQKTQNFLTGKSIDDSVFRKANQTAQKEIQPIEPINYKRLLVRQQLFAHLNKLGHLSLEALQ